jgi:SAM-dependent methyltransferase
MNVESLLGGLRYHSVKRKHKTLAVESGICPICAQTLEVRQVSVIPPDLAKQWELKPKQIRAFDLREGSLCVHCGSNARLRALAMAIMEVLNLRYELGLGFFNELEKPEIGERLAGTAICELNNLSTLHGYVQTIPGLVYSEYGSAASSVPSEDLTRLSYDDETFDVFLMTDVLEHVPDVDSALRELWRVLKPGGWVVFTVPLLLSRKTRRRATLSSGGIIKHLAEASYHGNPSEMRRDMLVFYEFGADFVWWLKKSFDIYIYRSTELVPMNSVFACQKGVRI